jgi:uncharacterized membrane protein YoaK (UPF0700 family)
MCGHAFSLPAVPFPAAAGRLSAMPSPPRNPLLVAALLSFNGGFVDTVGFLGLQGLFVAHVTGNFVTLGAALVLGSHGILNKVLALPEFIAVVALARIAGNLLRTRNAPVLRIMLVGKVLFLLAFFVLAVRFGPFADHDSALALLTAFTGIAAMALQNGLQRVHLTALPPTTIMTGNTTQATLDAVDMLTGPTSADASGVRSRLGSMASGIATFALGCGVAAALYWLAGFWSLAVPVVVGAATVFHRGVEAVPPRAA